MAKLFIFELPDHVAEALEEYATDRDLTHDAAAAAAFSLFLMQNQPGNSPTKERQTKERQLSRTYLDILFKRRPANV
jgi:hypothetical protein